MDNQSTVTEFLLTGFADARDMQVLHFMIFLFVYVTAVLGNLFVIATVAKNHHLHTPMYLFLANLSFLDVCYISTTVPKSMAVSITKNEVISFAGCVAQVFLVVTFAGGELFLLTAMAYDRYVAICHPLQYNVIMTWNACIQMAAAAWISSLVNAVFETSLSFRVKFCGSNKIGQFFCDIPLLQKISCTDTKIHQIIIVILGLIVVTFCIGLLFASYGYIFSAVLKIPSDQARSKAFSTCTPHLTVVSLFVSTATFSYLIPKTLSTPIVDLVSASLYTILPPVLNPIIYSLRNKDMQESIWKLLCKLEYLG